jgi:hypothetical protein
MCLERLVGASKRRVSASNMSESLLLLFEAPTGLEQEQQACQCLKLQQKAPRRLEQQQKAVQCLEEGSSANVAIWAAQPRCLHAGDMCTVCLIAHFLYVSVSSYWHLRLAHQHVRQHAGPQF